MPAESVAAFAPHGSGGPSPQPGGAGRRRAGVDRARPIVRPAPARCASSTTAASWAGIRRGGRRRLHALRRFEAKLDEHRGTCARAAVELARTGGPFACAAARGRSCGGRSASTRSSSPGTGDVIEPDDGLIGIGSAARTRWQPRGPSRSTPIWTPRPSRRKQCGSPRRSAVYTNDTITVEVL